MRQASRRTSALLLRGQRCHAVGRGDARSMTTGIFSNHSLVGEADIQFLRTISWAAEGGADINECMLAAQQCGTGDDALQWYDAWDALARKSFSEATGRLDTNPVGAASSLLRTCNYARTSAFFLRGDLAETERVHSAYALSNEAFGLAAPRLAMPLTPASIPMSDGSMAMPAYYSRAPAPPAGMTRSPLLIAMEGYDSDLCEAYLCGGAARINSYGFHILIFEGPGQGASAPPHLPSVPFRHDFEAVLSSVIDAAIGTCGFKLDDGIVVYGPSLGGHLVSRSAIHETRPSAYVCDPFNPSLRAAVEQMLPKPLLADLANDAPGSEQTRSAWVGMGAKMRHKLASRAQAHGIDVGKSDFAFDYLKEILRWHVDLSEYERLRVPLLMLATEEDSISGSGGPAAVMPHIQKSPAADDSAVIPMKSSEGAGLHISVGARSLVWERVMDRLLPLMRKKVG